MALNLESQGLGTETLSNGGTMKPLFILFTQFSATLLMSLAAYADQPYSIGQPVIDGNGCPAGTVRAVESPDGSAISILFDNFKVEVNPGRYTKEQMRRHCRFQIPINLKAGYNLDLSQIDYRGFADLNNGNRGFLITTGNMPSLAEFTVGDHQLTTQLPAGTDGFLISQPLKLRIRNRCQPMRNLVFNTFIQVLGPHGRGGGTIVQEPMMVMVDSADLGGQTQDAITLRIAVTPCIR